MVPTVESDFRPLREKVSRGELAAKMPEEDRELMLSVSKPWTDREIPIIPSQETIELMAGMFERAKRFLSEDKDFLKMIYDHDHVITPLQKIMHAFIYDEVSREEAAEKLDEYAAKVRRRMPELFPKESLST